MIDYPQNDPPIQGHAERMVEIAEAQERLLAMSHFAAVTYWNDGVEILGIFSDLASALAVQEGVTVQEWDGQKMRRWWSLEDHSEWEGMADF